MASQQAFSIQRLVLSIAREGQFYTIKIETISEGAIPAREIERVLGGIVIPGVLKRSNGSMLTILTPGIIKVITDIELGTLVLNFFLWEFELIDIKQNGIVVRGIIDVVVVMPCDR